MTQAFALTGDSITPVEGFYAYMPNRPQLHNVIFNSAEATDTVVAGQAVVIDSTADNSLCPVVKVADETDEPTGIVVYDCVKNAHGVGEKIAIAQTGSVIYLVAGSAITAGALLQFDATTRKVDDTTTSGNAYIGKALTSATADGDLIQVELNLELGLAE